MEGFDNACFEKWKQITYPKVLFSASMREDDSCVYYSNYESSGCVPDLIPKREFYKDNMLIYTVNSIEAKLNLR